MPLQPVVPSAIADSTITSATVNAAAMRARCCRKIHPKRMLKGSRIPASSAPPLPPRLFMACVPPVNGEFVSIVSCAIALPLADSFTDGLEK